MAINTEMLNQLIEEKLKPVVKKVDEQAYYAEDFIATVAAAGFFDSSNKDQTELLRDEAEVVLETAKVCMTTAFCIWCHLAALTYIRKSNNSYLKQTLLPQLEGGELLGATGLSNPMKYYSGLEKLHLSAEKAEGGYIINGVLPAVSNLGGRHYFGLIASAGSEEVMLIVSTQAKGLTLKEKIGFIGVNGSATYTCKFVDVFVPDEQIISEQAKDFADRIRPTFIYYQIPLGAGVLASAAEGIEKTKGKQNGCNEYLSVQANDLRNQYSRIIQGIDEQAKGLSLKEIVDLRLQTVEETLKAVQANMIHNGAAGYVAGSIPSRKLREAYFFANLTPTVRHLEKIKASL